VWRLEREQVQQPVSSRAARTPNLESLTKASVPK
jgi:hypothetical protein